MDTDTALKLSKVRLLTDWERHAQSGSPLDYRCLR